MPQLHYVVSLPRPETHLFHVEMHIDDLAEPACDLVMPSWTPGSYLIREFARHVQEFAAFCPQTGEPLPWRKVNKNTWRVARDGCAGVHVRYKVYANDLTVRTSHLDSSHGYFNGANLFMFAEGYRGQPVTLTVAPPYLDWKVSTGLPRMAGEGDGRRPSQFRSGANGGNGQHEPAAASRQPLCHFHADDYDHLVDCPVEIGNHRLLSFAVDGVPHQIALWGHGNEDADRLAADVQAIVQAARDLFGALPYEYYLFILHLTERRRGGLEHRNSSTNAVGRWSFRKPGDYERVLALLAHEFFHTWNVKRIEPASFSQLDYRWETYTRLLWVMEGFTAYYETVLLRRANLITAQRMLDIYGEQILRLLQTPGRHFQSAEAASFDAWIKFYRPDENTQNTSVSYYQKGCLIAMLLDLELRQRTGSRDLDTSLLDPRGDISLADQRSLDDVMVKTYCDYTLRGLGVPDDQFQAICEAVAGGSLQQFFDDYVAGVAELPFATYLGYAGLNMALGWKGDEHGERPAGLGMRLRSEQGRTVVDTVFADGPAYHADISAGDELIAMDGYRISKESLGDRLADRQPGEQVTLTFFRRDELREVGLTLGQRPYNKVTIAPSADASAAQRAIYERWLGAAWPATTVETDSGRPDAPLLDATVAV